LVDHLIQQSTNKRNLFAFGSNLPTSDQPDTSTYSYHMQCRHHNLSRYHPSTKHARLTSTSFISPHSLNTNDDKSSHSQAHFINNSKNHNLQIQIRTRKSNRWRTLLNNCEQRRGGAWQASLLNARGANREDSRVVDSALEMGIHLKYRKIHSLFDYSRINGESIHIKT
jgi:hypothetical protein